MISTTSNKKVYQCDGSQTVFPYDFLIFQDSDLEVSLYEIASGNTTVLTLTTDYTVSGAGDPSGGNVTTVSTYSSDYKLIIRRVMPLTQETDYVANDPFPAETHEQALDKLTMIAQQFQEQLDRILVRDITQTGALTFPNLQTGQFLTNDGTNLVWATPSQTDFNGTITAGLDANKPSSPSVNDVYVATDTLAIYICKTAGSWSLLKKVDLSGSVAADLSDITSPGADIEDAVTKKHSQNTDSVIKDADADTSVDAEQSSDEDKLRFKTAGTERAVLDSNGLQISVASPSTPQANTLVKDNIVKGWVSFDGTGTVSIYDSFNVSSITDNGTGNYTINWNTDFANANYSFAGMSRRSTFVGFEIPYTSYILAGSITIKVFTDTGSAYDSEATIIAIGDQ